jgi:hypothetical protein
VDDLVTHFFADEAGELRERIVELSQRIVELSERNVHLEDNNTWLTDALKVNLAQLHSSTVQGTRTAARLSDVGELLRLERQENSLLRAQLRARQEEAAP